MTITTLPEPETQPLRGGPALRWGVLAPGRIAAGWEARVHTNTDQRVVAVASRTLARAEAFAAAQYVSDGLFQSPLHSLDDSIAVLEALDSARAQVRAA